MIEQYDSASFMLRANARYLHGTDFGVWDTIPYNIPPQVFRPMIGALNWLPDRRKIDLSVGISSMQAVGFDEALQLDEEQMAESIVKQYPDRPYPAIAIGSSNGALTHLYAALGIPWLPQTNLLMFNRKKPIQPDDLIADVVTGEQFASKMLAHNPNLRAYQMNDPAQDRFMAIRMSYFRLKFIDLPDAYKAFIERNLQPGGTILIVDCRYCWPATRISDRHSFQVGGYGGTTLEEYADGGPRVRQFLKRCGSPQTRFLVPRFNCDQREAEWGFDDDLGDRIIDFAAEKDFKVERLVFDSPEDPVTPVADFYEHWYRDLGRETSNLLIESFMLLEPYWCLRAGCVPFWAVFNARNSYDRITEFLDRHSYDNIYLTLFSNIVESIGVPGKAEWDTIIRRAKKKGVYVGTDINTFPYDLSTAFLFFEDVVKHVPERYDLPDPVSLDYFRDFLKSSGHSAISLVPEHAPVRA